jgi:multidrug resistance efflux pump
MEPPTHTPHVSPPGSHGVTSGAAPLPARTIGETAHPQPLEGLVRATLAMAGELDQTALLTTALAAARELTRASGSSFWAAGDTDATCRLAAGVGAEALRGITVPPALMLDAAAGTPDDQPAVTITVPVITHGRTIGFLRVSRDSAWDDATDGATNGATGFDASDRAVLALLAEATGSALRLAARIKADDRSGDIKLVQELSREIGSSLDLDRVLQTTVNIAARALDFDVGALALYENGRCDIRAIAGASAVDATTTAMQDLSFRAAWAAGTGEILYLSDREDPGSDAERIFLQMFGQELASADLRSGLYLPLRDDEGVVGILLFESKAPEFADAPALDVMGILASQATVAIRNAKLYSQVPLADALGALSARRAAFFAIPRRRRLWAAGIGAAVLAALTLVRWPLRVVAESPVLQPTEFAVARPYAAGLVERVFVREGDTVAIGAVVAQLSAIEARASRAAAEADVRAALRSAALAASRGDAAEQRLQAIREDAARAGLALRDDEIGRLAIRAPVAGVVLTARPELLQETRVAAGAPLLRIGRTDTLELLFGVDQRDVARVRAGEQVRLRLDVDAQQTFSGQVTMVGALPIGPADAHDSARVLYPVRAIVPNPSGVLRAGMLAQARVLTAPASVAGRLLITPARVLRLLWWRAWSWL